MKKTITAIAIIFLPIMAMAGIGDLLEIPDQLLAGTIIGIVTAFTIVCMAITAIDAAFRR